MNVLEVLIAAKEKIATRDCWTQGVHARAKDGLPTDRRATNAYSWCIVGAVLSITEGDLGWKALDLIRDQAMCGPITTWQDMPERTHEEVMAVFFMTIETVRAHG